MTMITPGTPAAHQLGLNMLARELAFEINTGMKRGRNYSPLATARSIGFTGRTKAQALKFVIESGADYSGETVQKALAKLGLEVKPA